MSRLRALTKYGTFSRPESELYKWLKKNKTKQLYTRSCAASCLAQLLCFSANLEAGALSTAEQVRLVETIVYGKIIHAETGDADPIKLLSFAARYVSDGFQVLTAGADCVTDNLRGVLTTPGIDVLPLKDIPDHSCMLCVVGEDFLHIVVLFRHGDNIYVSDPADHGISKYSIDGDMARCMEKIAGDIGFAGVCIDLKLNQTKAKAVVSKVMAEYHANTSAFETKYFIRHDTPKQLIDSGSRLLRFCIEAESVLPGQVAVMCKNAPDIIGDTPLAHFLKINAGVPSIFRLLVKTFVKHHELLEPSDYFDVLNLAEAHAPESVPVLLEQMLKQHNYARFLPGIRHLHHFVQRCTKHKQEKTAKHAILKCLEPENIFRFIDTVTDLQVLADSFSSSFPDEVETILRLIFDNDIFAPVFRESGMTLAFVEKYAPLYSWMEERFTAMKAATDSPTTVAASLKP